jgi:hypothetical protein
MLGGWQLLDVPDVGKIYPADVIARAKHFLANIPGGTGAYSDSRGAVPCRQDVCKVRILPQSLPPLNVNIMSGACAIAH